MKFSALTIAAALSMSPFSAAENLRGNQRKLSDDCVEVTLTGTMGGPWVYNGLAGPGTLVTYGTESSGCRDGGVLQFDVGRGTTMRLSELGLNASAVEAVFFTHLHSDHTDGFTDFMQYKFQFDMAPAHLPAVLNKKAVSVTCHDDLSVTVNGWEIDHSCEGLIDHIGDAFEASGELQQRRAEAPKTPTGVQLMRAPEGPSQLISKNIITATNEGVEAYTSKSGHMKVTAYKTAHTGGHMSYHIDTPAGSVVISGDASSGGNVPSTSPIVKEISQDVDVLVQSAIHPVLGPGSAFPQAFYARQANAVDIGAMAEEAGVKNLVLTHLIPSIGADPFIFTPVPGGALKENDWKKAVKKDGGYKGDITVGTDLAAIRIP